MINLVESGVSASFTTDGQGDQPTLEEENSVSFLLAPNQRAQNEYIPSAVINPDSATSDIAQNRDLGVPGREYFGSSESILGWPIFEGKYDRRWIESLIFDPTLPCHNLFEQPTSPRVADDSVRDRFEDPRQNSSKGPGVREEDVPRLVETFLLRVHVKNPIFDPEYLRKMARTVVEDGFDWKASSCLVVRSNFSGGSPH